MENSSAHSEWKIAALAGFFFLLLTIVLVHALARKLNHDEEQFVSAGALLLRSGFLPYRDYPFFHLPNQALIFAALFWTNDYLLLTARCFNAACAGFLLLAIFTVALRHFRAVHPHAWVIAAACSLILSLDPFFRFTAGRAWNHDLPVLSTAGAFFALLHGFNSKSVRRWIFVSGALLGVAVGTRLTFAVLTVPFALALICIAPPERSHWKSAALFFVGLLLALTPSVILYLVAPHQFVFGNFIYNGPLNFVFRENTAPEKVTLLHKGLTLLKQLAKGPSTVLLLAGIFWFGAQTFIRLGRRAPAARPELFALCLIIPFLILEALIPTPFHRQYFYAVIPFALLGNIYAVGHGAISSRGATRWLILLLVLSLGCSIESFATEKTILHPARWGAFATHDRGRAIRQVVAHGPVLTLDPIFPLEGGLTIYKEFATGNFAWRTAPFLSEDEEAEFNMVDLDDLEPYLQSNPPAAIVTRGVSTDDPLLQYLRTHACVPQQLEPGLLVWFLDRPPESAARNQ